MPKKVRSRKHLEFVASLPSMISGYRGDFIIGHHLLRAGGKAMGTKACDSLVVPLTHQEHMDLHANGNEIKWFEKHGWSYDRVLRYQNSLVMRSPCPNIRKTLEDL